MKEDKYAVLSRTAQAVMKNNNEYLQFNINRDNVEADDIGVRYLLTAVLEEKIKEYRRSLLKMGGQTSEEKYCQGVRENELKLPKGKGGKNCVTIQNGRLHLR